MEKKRPGRPPGKLTGGEGVAALRAQYVTDIVKIICVSQAELDGILGWGNSQVSKIERLERNLSDKRLREMVKKLRSNEILELDPETFKRLQDFLDTIQLPKPEIRKEISYHIPLTPYGFIGRDNEIDILLSYLSSDSDTNVINLTGINGIGKTYLALEVARRCKEASEYLQEPFFDAILAYAQKNKIRNENNENNKESTPSKLNQLLRHIIRHLSPKGLKDNDTGNQLEMLCKELLSQIRTLLIIDTFGGAIDEDLKKFIESIPAQSKVLVIDRSFSFNYQTEIILTTFTPQESKKIVKNICYEKQVKLDEKEECLIADVADGIPLVIRFIIENIPQLKLTRVDIFDFIYNKCYPLLWHIFQKNYDRLTFKSRILLSTFEILPTSLTGEFLCRCNNIDLSNDARDALFPLVEHGLIKTVGNPSSDLISQTYVASSLLMIFITSQELEHDKDKLHDNIIDFILNKITIYGSININFKKSSKLQQYIDENEELLSFVIDNLWKIPRFKEAIDLVPNIKLPKGHFKKITKMINMPYLNYSPKTSQWVHTHQNVEKTSDEQ